MSDSEIAKGSCLCRGIQVTASSRRRQVSACHCGMCRKWSGGPYLAVACGTDVTLDPPDKVGVFESSAWAERGFCKQCGTHLYYRLKETGQYFMPAGLFDDCDALEFQRQIFIDDKPPWYDFANHIETLTGAEVLALHAQSTDAPPDTFSTLAGVGEVRDLSGDTCIVDCRFSLMQPQLGAELYAQSHISGAVYAHLDEHLSGEIVFARSGRHPLPNRDEFASTLKNWGIGNATQVVAYDDSGGVFASRFWWLLRWMGHKKVALLDGGLGAWRDADLPLDNHPVQPEPAKFVARKSLARAVEAQDVLDNTNWRLIDAREGARYRGEAEPIDPVAGHIPGALNVPFQQNLDDDGLFKSANDLAKLYADPIGDKAIEDVICYCGSGVSAAHNVLAITHAGLGTPTMYAGSWSEWITDPERPIERGVPTR